MLFTLIKNLIQPSMFDPSDPMDIFGEIFGEITTLIFFIIIPIITFIISIILMIWVYKDAKKRDMNANAWLAIVFFTSCIGCIIYLVVRD
jgi:type IV secretory pathway TrbL component